MQITLNNGKIVTVEKLPLGKYADLLKAFQELPKQLEQLKDLRELSTDKFIQILPQLLGECLPDFIRVIKIATELTDEEVNSLGLDEASEILIAIYTVNNYAAVYEKLKKLTARPIRTEAVQEAIAIQEENTTPTT